jgi:hypothetical protein
MSANKMNLNLLPSQAKFQAERMRMEKLAKKILIIVAIVWVVAAVLIFAFWGGSGFVLGKEKDKYKKAVSSYLSLSDEVITSQLIKYRAKVLGKVLSDRFEYSTAFKKVSGLFGDQIKIAGFELRETSMFDVKNSCKIG